MNRLVAIILGRWQSLLASGNHYWLVAILAGGSHSWPVAIILGWLRNHSWPVAITTGWWQSRLASGNRYWPGTVGTQSDCHWPAVIATSQQLLPPACSLLYYCVLLCIIGYRYCLYCVSLHSFSSGLECPQGPVVFPEAYA